MLFSYGFMILLFAIIMTPITLRLYHGNRNGKPIYLLVNSLGYFLALAMILLGRGEKSQVGVSLGIVLLVLSLLGLLGSLWFMLWGPLSAENRRFGSILVMICVAV